MPPESRQAELDRALAGGGRATDLAVVRAAAAGLALFRLADDEHVLTLAIHHIAFDAWSDRRAPDELGRSLRRLTAAARDCSLPEPELQYADYAVWQREWLTGDALQRELDHWRAGARRRSPAAAPAARPAPPDGRSGSGAATSLSTSTPTSRRRSASSRPSQGVTVFMTLLAAFQALLHRYSGQARRCWSARRSPTAAASSSSR